MVRPATLLLAPVCSYVCGCICACATTHERAVFPELPPPAALLNATEASHQTAPPTPTNPDPGVATIESLPVVVLEPDVPASAVAGPPTSVTGAGAGGAIEERPSTRLPSLHPTRRKDAPPSRAGHLSFQWPLPATGVNSLFGPRRDPIDASERFHFGVDLAADYGEVVEATAPGVVIYAGWNGGHGRTLVVDHEGGYRSVYSHLSQILVYSGAWVEAGRAIGRVGNSGRSTGTHLHFELLRNGAHLDPLDWMGSSVAID